MTASVAIRPGAPDDRNGIEALYPDAFPDEDLLPVVRKLLDMPSGVLSLVAVEDGALVGHVIFTDCGLSDADARLALLGPLGVASARQGQGIGSALVRDGRERLRQAGITHVFVLGDPAYYARFGFEQGPAAELFMPGPFERARFLGLELRPGALAGASGVLRPTGVPLPVDVPAVATGARRQAA